MPLVCRLCAGLCLLSCLALSRSSEAETKCGILLFAGHHPKHARTRSDTLTNSPRHTLFDPAADKGDKTKAQKGWAGLKERANAFVKLANQRMPEESTPLSEIR